MSTGIHHFLTAVVPVATAAFAWVQHGKTPLYNRGSRRHFPAQVRPEFGLKRKPRASPVAFTIGQHSLNQREILFTAEPRQPGGCKLKTAPVRPVVAARPAEYVCSEDLFY